MLANTTSLIVLAAALCEGALVFSVRKGRELTNGKAFGARTFDGPPRGWYFDDLLKSARHESARIIDSNLSDDCAVLLENRQRIHAGRLIDEPVTPALLDLKPQDAEQGVNAARRLVGAVLEWFAAQGLAASR